MRKLLHSFQFLTVVSLLSVLIPSCTDEPAANEIFRIEDGSDIIADYAGGEYTISYTIENFASRGSVYAECGADWIKGLYCGEYGKVSFIVEENDSGSQRETSITVGYSVTGDKDSVKVIQTAETGGTGKEPILTLISPDTLSVPVLGGDYDLQYAVFNASDESGMVSVIPSEEWLSVSEVSENTVSIVAEPNISDVPRSATLRFEYGTAEPVSVSVDQASLTSERLEITVDSTGVRGAKVSVAPTDPIYMTYVVFVNLKEYIDALGSDYDIFMSDLALIQQYALSYDLTITEAMWIFLKQGNKSLVFEDLVPDTEYYCYGYGVTDSLDYLTVVCKEYFETNAINRVDCTFSLSAEATHNSAVVTVVPSDNDVPYICGLIDPDVFTLLYGAFSNESMQGLLTSIIDGLAENGVSIQDYIEGYAYTGSQEISFDDLEPETSQMAYCVGLDMNGEMVTDAYNLIFETSEDPTVPPMTFIFEAKEIEARSITASVTPSDNEIPYCWDLVDASLEEDDIKAAIQQEADLYISLGAVGTLAEYVEVYLAVNGYREKTFGNLVPATAYKLYAIQLNSSGEYSRPMVFSRIYTTADAVTSDCSVTVLYDKYWNGADLAELYPDDFGGYEAYAVLPVAVSTEGDVASFGYALLAAEWADPSLYSDDDVIEYLNRHGFSSPTHYFFVTWDYEFAIVSVAVDSEGNYGRVIRKTEILRREGAADPSEFEFL